MERTPSVGNLVGAAAFAAAVAASTVLPQPAPPYIVRVVPSAASAR